MNVISFSVLSCAFLLLAQSASKDGKHAKVWLYGFVATFIFAISFQFQASATIYSFAFSSILSVAVGLLLSSFVFRKQLKHSKPFTFTAILLLLLVGILGLGELGVYLLSTSSDRQSNSSQLKVSSVAGRIILELGEDDNIEEIEKILTKHSAVAEKAFPGLSLSDDQDLAQVFVVSVPAANEEALKQELIADSENVDAAESELIMSAIPNINASGTERLKTPDSFLANDPELKQQWGFVKSEGRKVHEQLRKLKPKRKAIVAIVDTGVDASHEDIAKVWDSSPGNSDGNGHGTHCAGIAGAMTNNGIGIGSYNWGGKFITIRGYKALGDSGGGSSETVAQAILDAARDGADVISLSLGGYSPNPPRVTVQAVKFALKKGCILVVAAGNSNMDASKFSPANIDGVITVGALDQNMRKATFSNTNNSLNMPIAAPGVDILSLKSGGDYVSLSGTSMATPMVAGLLGLMRAMKPKIDTKAAYKVLKDSAQSGPDSDKVGLAINAAAALESCR